jgi:hypothetical protein
MPRHLLDAHLDEDEWSVRLDNTLGACQYRNSRPFDVDLQKIDTMVHDLV